MKIKVFLALVATLISNILICQISSAAHDSTVTSTTNSSFIEKFRGERNDRNKQGLARAILRADANNEEAFNYLYSKALISVKDERPFPLAFSGTGRILLRELSPEFVKWCKSKNLDQNVQVSISIFDMPNDVGYLVGSHQDRALQVFKQGLHSNNYYIVSQSIKGLAVLGYKPEKEYILNRFRKSPYDMKIVMASSLLYFKDNEIGEIVKEELHDDPLFIAMIPKD